jgi:RND family efflux transporter MFP subunit
MGSTLREELASLKIDRSDPLEWRTIQQGSAPLRRRRGAGMVFLSWVLWLIPLGLLAAAGFFGYRQYEQMRSRPVVKVALVERMTTGESEKLFTANGYLKSRFQAMIGTKLPGRVEKMCVEEGMKVKKGDTLAIIEHNDMKAMLASREAQVLRTAAELDGARVEVWQKERESHRVSRLYSQRSATPEENEKALAEHKMAIAKVEALEAALKLMKANVEEMRATIVTMHLFAPFDGTVVEKQGEEGEIITPAAMSSSLGRTAVVTIADLEKMDVETNVPEKLMSQIDVGQPAEVVLLANPAKRYRGRLRQVIPMSDRTRNTVKMKVEILDPDDKLFPELAASVDFLPRKTAAASDASRTFFFVTRSAVVHGEGSDYVWVVGRNNILEKRRVEVTLGSGASVKVESGLEYRESVVSDPAKTLRQNEVVKIAD